jgi:hypothetical protein
VIDHVAFARSRLAFGHDRGAPSRTPAGIRLYPVRLEVEFFGTGELLKQLYALSQVIVNDLVWFESLIE